MPYDNPCAKIALESGDRLGRQIDLRNQYQGLILISQVFFQVMKVDLGFSATGDAVQKERGKPFVRASQLVCGRCLRLG